MLVDLSESFAVIALLIFAIVWRAEKASAIENFSSMAIENTIALRGAFSIIILLHHLSGYINNITFLFPLRYCGYIIVAYFFFFSGYGLTWGVDKKSNYLNHFLVKRIPKIYIPYLISMIVYAAYGYFFNNAVPTLKQLLLSLVCIDSISPLGWYIGAVILMYIIFYISARFAPAYRRVVFWILFAAVYFALFFAPVAREFTRSLIGFPMGIYFCFYQKKIEEALRRKYFLYFMIGLVGTAFGFAVKWFGEEKNIGAVKLCGNVISCAFAILILILIINKFRFGNKLLAVFGALSFEIYLYHKLFLELFYKFELCKVHCLIFSLATVISTVVLSYVISLLDNGISRAINNHFRRKDGSS